MFSFAIDLLFSFAILNTSNQQTQPKGNHMKTIATAARHIYGEHAHSTGRIVQIGRRIEIRHVDGSVEKARDRVHASALVHQKHPMAYVGQPA